MLGLSAWNACTSSDNTFNFFTKEHDVFIIFLRKFYAFIVIVFNRMKIRRLDRLPSTPCLDDGVFSVFLRNGRDSGDISKMNTSNKNTKYMKTFQFLFDVIIKRRHTVWVFLSCADIHVSICIRAILRRPSSCPKPSSYPRNFIAKNHYIFRTSFREFFTIGVVVCDGMKMGWSALLVCVPGFDGVSQVFLLGGDGG